MVCWKYYDYLMCQKWVWRDWFIQKVALLSYEFVGLGSFFLDWERSWRIGCWPLWEFNLRFLWGGGMKEKKREMAGLSEDTANRSGGTGQWPTGFSSCQAIYAPIPWFALKLWGDSGTPRTTRTLFCFILWKEFWPILISKRPSTPTI